jgi:hypothetical protein
MFVLLAAAVSSAQTSTVKLENTRVAKGNTLVSDSTPRLKLKFSKPFKYAGGQTFILYDVARAEQHFYVDADKEGRISRLYWVQFEGYLPENNYRYDYSLSQRQVTIGGLNFYADAMARNNDPSRSRPNSDGSRAQEFLRSKGFTFKRDDFLMQRLVNMVDPTNRNELMVIYLEVLPDGQSAADFNPNGKDFAKWPTMADQPLARAQQNMTIEQ